jgi:uncharacterized protein (TIGR02001 family)
MKLLTKIAIAAAGLLGTATAAFAEDAPPAPAFVLSAVIAGQSDYRFRGVSQDSREFTPQGTLTLTGPDGFYASLWTSKTNWGGNNPSFELDEFVGKHTDLDGTDLNLEAYYYSYPDNNRGKPAGPVASYYETIGQLTHVFGPLTLTLTGANSPAWSLGGGVGWYVEGTAAWAVNDWLTLSGNVGHQWVGHAPSDYTHYDIGGTAVWKSWSLDARYVSTDITKGACTAFWMATPHACSGGAMVTLSYNIADLLK